EILSELLLKHHTDEPPSLDSFRSDVPPQVQSIIRKLLAKRPEDRFQTATELLAALPGVRKKLASGDAPPQIQPTVVDLAGRVTPLVAAQRRPGAGRKRVAVVAACAGVLLLAGLALALGLSSSPDRDTAVAQASRPGDATFPVRPGPTRPA